MQTVAKCWPIIRRIALKIEQWEFSLQQHGTIKSKAGGGFIIVDSNTNIECAGFLPIDINWRVKMEIATIIEAMKVISDWNGRCSKIYISSNDCWEFVSSRQSGIISLESFKHHKWYQIQSFLMNNPQINLIQHTSNKVAAALAGHGIKARHISLFHKGLDMPRWLMKMFANTGLHFWVSLFVSLVVFSFVFLFVLLFVSFV